MDEEIFQRAINELGLKQARFRLALIELKDIQKQAYKRATELESKTYKLYEMAKNAGVRQSGIE